MKIWLDDLRDPNSPFVQKNKGTTDDMIWVKDPLECVRYIESGKVTHISFDHDLGFSDVENHPKAGLVDSY